MTPSPNEWHALLSEDRFSCLDYLNYSELDSAQRAHIIEQCNDIFYCFFKTIRCEYVKPDPDRHLRETLWTWAEAELTKAHSCDMKTLEKALEVAASIVEHSYPLASFEIRLSMAKGTASVTALDDYQIHPNAKAKVSRSLKQTLMGHEAEDEFYALFHPFLKESAGLFGAKDPLIGLFCSNGWRQYVEGWCLEERLWKTYHRAEAGERSAKRVKICHVEDFPYYLRSHTGVPLPYIAATFKPTRVIEAPYSLWVSCVPAMTTMINLSNDLLSYPKELLDEEHFTYVNLLTQTKQDAGFRSQFAPDSPWTFRDSLYDTFTRTVQSIQALDQAFVVSSPAAADLSGHSLYDFQLAATLWSLFKRGYLSWHVNCPRYGLDTLRSRLEKDAEAE